MALKGITVLEIAHLPPASASTRFLCDFGAKVIRIAQPGVTRPDHAYAGKLSMEMDIKNPESREIIKQLAKKADVFIECLRPGAMERLGLGPEDLQKDNPRLIYARYSGYGQTGPRAQKSGHDSNFAALSGVLPMLAERKGGASAVYPMYVMTVGAASLLFAYGILAAVISRQSTGRGQILDHATNHGMAYGASYLFSSWGCKIMWYNKGRLFSNDIYKTKDDQYVAVSIFEPQYLKVFLKALRLQEFYKIATNDEMAQKLEKIFLTKTRNEWMDILGPIDACVAPVLTAEEAAQEEHNQARGVFARKADNRLLPNPTPLLSETPAENSGLKQRHPEEQLQKIMQVIGVGEEETASLVKRGIVQPLQGIDGSVWCKL